MKKIVVYIRDSCIIIFTHHYNEVYQVPLNMYIPIVRFLMSVISKGNNKPVCGC